MEARSTLVGRLIVIELLSSKAVAMTFNNTRLRNPAPDVVKNA